jgi:hypothetical protein
MKEIWDNWPKNRSFIFDAAGTATPSWQMVEFPRVSLACRPCPSFQITCRKLPYIKAVARLEPFWLLVGKKSKCSVICVEAAYGAEF